jgi:hypothetical protein
VTVSQVRVGKDTEQRVARWLPAGAFVHLTGGRSEALNTDHVRPLRLELRHAVEVLRVFGYAEGAA